MGRIVKVLVLALGLMSVFGSVFGGEREARAAQTLYGPDANGCSFIEENGVWTSALCEGADYWTYFYTAVQGAWVYTGRVQFFGWAEYWMESADGTSAHVYANGAMRVTYPNGSSRFFATREQEAELMAQAIVTTSQSGVVAEITAPDCYFGYVVGNTCYSYE